MIFIMGIDWSLNKMEYYNKLMHIITSYQYELNRYISGSIRDINDDSSLYSSIIIIFIAFIYGVVHAIGPGHGKSLVALYFTSNKSNYKKAFKMGYMISIIHAMFALIFTFSIFFIFKTMFRQNFNEFSHIAILISSIMISSVGLYLIYEAYIHRKQTEQEHKITNKSEFTVALSAGIVPCPGVMTIVLFCIVLGKYTLGIVSAIAMSIGMGLTISIAGIFSILLNKKISSKLKNISYFLEMLGGLLVFTLGLFLSSNYS